MPMKAQAQAQAHTHTHHDSNDINTRAHARAHTHTHTHSMQARRGQSRAFQSPAAISPEPWTLNRADDQCVERLHGQREFVCAAGIVREGISLCYTCAACIARGLSGALCPDIKTESPSLSQTRPGRNQSPRLCHQREQSLHCPQTSALVCNIVHTAPLSYSVTSPT